MTTTQTTEKAIPTQPEQAAPVKPITDSTKPAASEQQSLSPAKKSGKRPNHLKTPKPKGKDASDKKGNNSAESTAKSSNASQNSSAKSKNQKSSPQKQRNFYNPPQKVLRHLAQQSYYDYFYGNQRKNHPLKLKYKTSLCRHFEEHGTCPLDKYCQFAHGSEDLRQPNDPLPKNFGKTALGAVHSNFKTMPCKYYHANPRQECKYGDSCSFYHEESESRKLIDPLPNVPEGVTLPPMSGKLWQKHRGRNFHGRNNTGKRNVTNKECQDWNGFVQNGISQFGQQNFLQLTNIDDIAAIGGFNPNKYLQGPPPPQPVQQFSAAQQVFEQAKAAEEKDQDAKVDQPATEQTDEPALVEAAK